MSLVLRDEPQKIGITLDQQGWVDVENLLAASKAKGFGMTRAELQVLVEKNDKKRFAFSEDGGRTRASQGHSIEVTLGYTAIIPTEHLFHGTATRFLQSIRLQPD